MRTAFRFALTALLCTSLPLAAQAAGEGWTTNMAAALKQASAEKKDLLLDFTGSDWCGWCIRLNDEVFKKPEFKTEAPKHFVLVELDFPNDKSKLTPEIIKQNETWRQNLGVSGFPSIFLVDAAGVPYAQTGYQAGGPEKYLAHLAELRGVRVKRDAALAKADKAKGLEKAKFLDEALTAVGEQLAMQVYTKHVSEIIELDAKNAAGLKEKYEAKLNEVEFQKVLAQVESSFDRADPAKSAAAAIKTLDEAVAKYTPTGEPLMVAMMTKLSLLNIGGQPDEALKLTDKLLTDKNLPEMMRLQISVQKATILAANDKLDQAVKVMDEVIAAQPATSRFRFQLYLAKANMLEGAGKVNEAAAALDAAIAATDNPNIQAQIKAMKAEMLGNKPDAKAPDAKAPDKKK